MKHLDMALNAWQKITRVLPGKPFGDGKDGDYSSSSIPTMTRQSCSGSANSTTLSLGAAGFANGDVILIHQTRGTGAGQWEINQVSSGGGTTSLTLKVALKYTYTDSGASQAQVVKIPRYKNVTVPSGATWAVPGWDGNVGGILAFACNGVLTPTGTISANSAGHLGGAGTNSSTESVGYANQGEGSGGAGSATSAANGSGGGGGNKVSGSANGSGAGGGGNGTAGTTGQKKGANAGVGGTIIGNNSLTEIGLGGGGGGARQWESGSAGAGGKGAGIIFIFAKKIVTISSIIAIGANAGSSSCNAGKPDDRRVLGNAGGGAGGSILLCSEIIDIGTDKLNVVGGSGATGGTNCWSTANGGAGGKGRIAVYYGKSLSGSVSSTYYGTLTTEKDTGLVEAQGVGTYWFM